MNSYVSLLFLTILTFGCHSKSEDTPGGEHTNRLTPEQTSTPAKESDGTCDKFVGSGIVSSSEARPSKNSKYCVKLEWIAGPKSDDYSEAKLTFTTPDLKLPHNVQKVKVTPWMKIHGHGTGDVQPELNSFDGSDHIFKATNIYFTMSGPWELWIDAEVDGVQDRLELNVQVPN